jgi:hypothetical protein
VLAGFVPRLLPGSGNRAATAGPPKLSVVPPVGEKPVATRPFGADNAPTRLLPVHSDASPARPDPAAGRAVSAAPQVHAVAGQYGSAARESGSAVDRSADRRFGSAAAPTGNRRARPLLALAGALVVLAGSGVLVTVAVSRWVPTLNHQWTADDDRSERAVVDWLGAAVPHDAVLVPEGELWLDLHDAGFAHANNVWVYKVDSDPAVQRQLGRWQNIDYLALSHATLTSESQATMPWVFEAIRNADTVTTFGIGDDRVTVLKVRK